MSKIRDRMQQDLVRAGYTAHTVSVHLCCVRDLVEHFGGRPPLKLGQDEMRSYVDELERPELSPQRIRQYLAAFKFLYGRTLGRPDQIAWITFPRARRRTPHILSGSEVALIIDSIESVTCRTVATVCYGAGLRIDEARHLEVRDILSERGLLHVRFGKGGHERFAMLSPRRAARLATWLASHAPLSSGHVPRDAFFGGRFVHAR